MSKVEHDPALVERAKKVAILATREASYNAAIGEVVYDNEVISAIINAVLEWQAEHAEPHQTLHDAASIALKALDGAWVILDERTRTAYFYAFHALKELCDAVKGMQTNDGLTTDPKDPRLGVPGLDGQNEAYLVLSEEERAKGFVRPVRRSYVHVGIPNPKYPLRDLTPEESERYVDEHYVKFEVYPESEYPVVGTFWTQSGLDDIGKGCGSVTTMGRALAETYARNPNFYSATFCAACQRHYPVGKKGEFVWSGTIERVGT